MTKDTLFAEQVKSGKWPQDSCPNCQRVRGCCKRYGHHHLDCCTHCGNDERDPRRWDFRGNGDGKQ